MRRCAIGVRAAAALCLSALAGPPLNAFAASADASFAVRVQLATGCLNSSLVPRADPVVTIVCAGRQPVEIRQIRPGDVASPAGWLIERQALDAAQPLAGTLGGPLWTVRLDDGQAYVEFLVGW